MTEPLTTAETLLDRLFDAQCGGCTCMVKPPDVKWHAPDCHYRLFFEAWHVLDDARCAFGIGDKTITHATLIANIENAIRRNDCLSATEHEFFTRIVEDGEGEAIEECHLNWAASPDEYVEQFRAALTQRDASQLESITAQHVLDLALIAHKDERIAAFEQQVKACDYQCEIATVEVRDGKIVGTTMKNPGLPDGLHDLFCADPREVRPLPGASAPPVNARPPHDAQSFEDAIRRIDAWLDSPSEKGGLWLDHVPDSFMDAWGNADALLAALRAPAEQSQTDYQPLTQPPLLVQACRPADRAMLATPAGQELLGAAVKHMRAQPTQGVKATPVLHDLARKYNGIEMVTLDAAVSCYSNLLTDCAQILDGWKNSDPNCWTSFDQSVRERISAALAAPAAVQATATDDVVEVLRSLLDQCRPYVVQCDREGPYAHPRLLLNMIDGVVRTAPTKEGSHATK